MQQVIDNIIDRLVADRERVALVVGIIQRDQSSVFGYGNVGDADSRTPDGETLFEVGSVTKLFTTTLLAIAVADGLVSLDSRVRDLLPKLSNLPPHMTLLRLATHTSGLPKMPANILRSMMQNRGNPYAAYTLDDLERYLGSYRPRSRGGQADRVEYSNLGAALLGHTLAHVMGATYEEAVVGRICNPLDLADTRISLTQEQQARMAPPCLASGRPGQNWDLGAFAGAGAMRSTANDMNMFLAANLGYLGTNLNDVLQKCHETQVGVVKPPGRRQAFLAKLLRRELETSHYHQGTALGWVVGHLKTGNRMLWHHGATGGYRAFVGMVKDAGAAVVVLGNRGPARSDLFLGRTWADEIGFQVLEHLGK